MNLDKAFEIYEIDLQDKYKSLVTFKFEQLVSQFGEHMKGVHNSTLARVWTSLVRPNTISVETGIKNINQWYIYQLDEEKLEKNSKKYSANSIAAIKAKILSKVGQLDNVTVNYAGSCTFNLTGEKDGKKVHIEQIIVLKESNKGMLFNQFPARIWVDGKFTSESKYKLMF